MLFNCQKLSEYRMMLVTKGQIPWGQRLCVNQVTMWLCTLLGGMVVYRLALSKLLQRHEVQTHILIKRFFRKATFQDYDGIQPSIYNPDKSLYLKKESRFAFLKRFNKKKHYSGIKEREAKNPELPDDITKKCKVWSWLARILAQKMTAISKSEINGLHCHVAACHQTYPWRWWPTLDCVHYVNYVLITTNEGLILVIHMHL